MGRQAGIQSAHILQFDLKWWEVGAERAVRCEAKIIIQQIFFYSAHANLHLRQVKHLTSQASVREGDNISEHVLKD